MKDCVSKETRPEAEKPKAKAPAEPPPQTTYEAMIEKAVVAAYRAHHANVAAMERALQKKGVAITRRRIGAMLDELGLSRVKKPRRP